ncbi:hypothetical protein [Microbacterium sp.]|uniref:hypothetical protein n=1 Tax=Microbacterium sp. TaxID=51671 RepID=UPI0039E35F18
MVFALALVVPGAIVGSAFADMVALPVAGHRRSLNDALAIAREATPWRIRLPSRPQRTSNDPDTEKVMIALLVIAVVVAVARYSQYVGEIAYALVLFSAIVFAGTLLSFIVFWAKKCVDGGSIAWRILLSLVLWTTGLFNAYWLQNAPLHGDAVGHFRGLVDRHGPIGAFFKAPPGEFQQVANQMIGAFLCVLMLVVFIALCLASISGVYIASYGRPRWFWLALFWTNAWAVRLWVWIVAVAIGVLALVCTSGMAFDGGEAFAHWFKTLIPTSTPTPTPSM